MLVILSNSILSNLRIHALFSPPFVTLMPPNPIKDIELAFIPLYIVREYLIGHWGLMLMASSFGPSMGHS